MDTYTIAEAAQLVGTLKAKLYQAIRAGRLQALAGQEPGVVLRVTPEALRAAGFALPPAPRPASPPAPATPEAAAPEVPSLPPERPGQDQALIAHLERALEQAQARELRLLDLLADLTRPRSAPQAPPAPVLPAAGPRTVARPPLSGLRQQIVAVVHQHPEGIAPRDVRTLLAVDHDVRSTMKGLVRSGILTRRAAGRYVVAPEGAGP
jgi:hypothetical protein